MICTLYGLIKSVPSLHTEEDTNFSYSPQTFCSTNLRLISNQKIISFIEIMRDIYFPFFMFRDVQRIFSINENLTHILVEIYFDIHLHIL